jgi:hypothetical protein
MTHPQSLYRMYDAHGSLLYVGITQRRMQRFHEHSASQPWWSQVARIDVEHHPDRASVEAAERHAIQTEDPHYNVVGRRGTTYLPRRRQPAAAGPRPLDLAPGSDYMPHSKGRLYWLIQLDDGRAVTIHADEVAVGPDGSLSMISTHRLVGEAYEARPQPLPLLVLPAGKWDMVHAASVSDGSPLGVDHVNPVESR